MKSHKIFLFTWIYWICDDQRQEIGKNLQCKSIIPYFQQSEWIL